MTDAPDAGRWARRFGAAAHLGKPFNLSALLALVARVLNAGAQDGPP